MTHQVVICAPTPGTTRKYRCQCCEDESDDIEWFGGSLCWDCTSGNLDCPRCIAAGVSVNVFGGRNPKSHRLRFMAGSGKTRFAVTTCGLRVPYVNIGMAGGLEECKKCWREK